MLEPLDLMARPAALVPPPRMHLTRFHGVFAPHSPLRAAPEAGVWDRDRGLCPLRWQACNHRERRGAAGHRLGSRVMPGGLDAELAAVTGVVIDAEKGVGYFSGAFLAPQPIIVERRCDIDMGGRKSNTAQPDAQQFFPWIEGAPLRYFAGERISGGDTIAHGRFEIDGSYGDIIDVPKPAHIVVDWKLTKR